MLLPHAALLRMLHAPTCGQLSHLLPHCPAMIMPADCRRRGSTTTSMTILRSPCWPGNGDTHSSWHQLVPSGVGPAPFPMIVVGPVSFAAGQHQPHQRASSPPSTGTGEPNRAVAKRLPAHESSQRAPAARRKSPLHGYCDPTAAYPRLDPRLFGAHRAGIRRIRHQRVGRNVAE
jgi:hypothetical protein